MRGKCRPPAGDATAVLDDAHLAEILLRLASPATLARTAALVCRRWRRVASSPAFLRRFRRLHPPPLLGFFICKIGRAFQYVTLPRKEPDTPPGPVPVLDPTFLPVAVPPPGLGGAVGRLRDFSLSSLPSVDHWALADASSGLLLCSSPPESFSCSNPVELPEHRKIPKHFVVCDPLSGCSVLLPELDAGMYIGFYYLGAALITSDNEEDDIFSFEVLLVTLFDEGPHLCAFSSTSREWAVIPCPATDKLYDCRMPWIDHSMRAGGCVYWVVHAWEIDSHHLLVLNICTKKFSTINLPCSDMFEKYDRNIRVIRSDGDSDLRVVAMAWSSCTLHFWRRDTSRSTKGRWLKESSVMILSVPGVVDLLLKGGNGILGYTFPVRMIDAGEGFFFFKDHKSPWVHVLNLNEMNMQKLPNRRDYSGYALPYKMALSPPLPDFS